MQHSSFRGVGVAILGLGSGLLAQPSVIKDLNTTPSQMSSRPQDFAPVGDWSYFAAFREDIGTELFRTRAASGSTELVKDICPGWPTSNPEHFTAVGTTVFFAADDQVSGAELWKSDGTAAGTALVKDIAPGPNGSNPRRFVVLGREVLFTADDGVRGSELWKSDGTAAGTVLVADIWPGPMSSLVGSAVPRVWRNEVFFSAFSPELGEELWKSNGTAAGTVLVTEIHPGGSAHPAGFTEIGGILLFSADDGTRGVELWKTDGTAAGTALVKDINPGPPNASHSNPQNFFPLLDNIVCFQADDGVRGVELWKSDGTGAGTQLVRDIWPGPSSSSPIHFARVGTEVLFTADDGVLGPELWASNGTSEGTRLVKETFPLFLPLPGPEFTTGLPNGIAVFLVDEGVGSKLWRTDATPAGTWVIKELENRARGLHRYGSVVLFGADDGVHGIEPWASDGTIAGTRLVDDVAPPVTADSDPTEFTDALGFTLFAADDGVTGKELWKTDGTAAGTALVKDLFVGPSSSSPRGLTLVGSTVFFAANSAANPSLWTTDGTAAGTAPVALAQPVELAALGEIAIFSQLANPMYVGPSELWRSDGTAAGTVLLGELFDAAEFTHFAGKLFFRASKPGSGGLELWKTDGTAAGTELVSDINPGGNAGPRDFTVLGGTLYFSALHNAAGFELWKTDGTAAGTTMVVDLFPGAGSSRPTEITRIGDLLYFAADDGVSGTELWKSDGTAAGTVLVADLMPGSASSALSELTALDDKLLFVYDTRPGYVSDREVWCSDGTPGGTFPLASFRYPGPDKFTTVGRRAYFAATRSVFGNPTDLWVTDGTAPGTMPLSSLTSQPPEIAELALASGRLFWSGIRDLVGREPWSLDPGATAQAIGAACGAQTPSLTATSPVLGATVRARGDAVTSGLAGALLLGAPARALPLGGICHLYVDPRSAAVLGTFVTAPRGTWEIAFPLPNVPALAGLAVALQAVVAPTASPLGFDLTNGVRLTLGS